jgi:outer membrane protein OmpA-like peptidoglycan-associated protein/ABC-type nitrate/sulfonate/bicarbonate transport system substrate-binding protein
MKHWQIALTIVVVTTVLIGGYRIVEPLVSNAQQYDSSDARDIDHIIKIAVDGWVGYYPLCSAEIKSRLRQQGYGLKCTDDKADYADRYKKLKKGDYDFVVGTIDSYILNAEVFDYPGPIIAVIDESKGGDALVAWKDKHENLQSFKDSKEFKIALTPDSPSHHLLKSISSHFDMEMLLDRGNLSFSIGSEDALKMLNEKSVSAAVLWEPDVSKALKNGDIVNLLSTADTQKLIVDVLIASTDIVNDSPEIVDVLLGAYFKTLHHYRNNSDDLSDEISDYYDINSAQAKSLLAGVQWVTLQDNANSWFGIGGGSANQYLVDTIESSIEILIESNDFKTNPLPNRDPYRIISSRYIKSLSDHVLQTGFGSKQTGDANIITFSPLTDSKWENLKEVGTLKVRPVLFASGTSDLTLEGKKQIDRIVKSLSHYPSFRVEIRGHSGKRGDKKLNLLLSEDRAESVLRYIDITHGIDSNRVRSIGFGGSKPLAKKQGESNRSYNYRLPRVEIVLVSEVF